MNTVSNEAQEKLSREAEKIYSAKGNARKGVRYDVDSFKEAQRLHPDWAVEYSSGQQVIRKDFAQLSMIEREMAALRADPDRVMSSASSIVDHYARLKIGNNVGQPVSQLNPDTYRNALDAIRVYRV